MTALTTALEDKHAELLRKLERVREMRFNLAQQESELLRDIAACQSAARLFEIALAMPEGVSLPSLSVKQLAETVLSAAGGDGAKAKDIEAAYEAATGKRLHSKTVGMTLFRLKQEGRVTRDGQRWRLCATV